MPKLAKKGFAYFLYASLCFSFSCTWSSDHTEQEIDPAQARRAVAKVKRIFQAAQAREVDYGSAFQVFMHKFDNPSTCPKENLDIISPIWTLLYRHNLISLQNNNSQDELTTPNSLSPQKKKLLCELTAKKNTFIFAYEDFRLNFQRSQNIQKGIQFLVNMCDTYLNLGKEATTEHLKDLWDIILTSHLMGMRSLANRYLCPERTDHYVSFNQEEINQYYTQDIYITASSAIYYITDYLNALSYLMPLNLPMDKKEWSLAENTKKYLNWKKEYNACKKNHVNCNQKHLNGKIDLKDPGIFVLDGYLYNMALQKEGKEETLERLTQQAIYTEGEAAVVNVSDIHIEGLSRREMKEGKQNFSNLAAAHKISVQTYIKNLTSNDRACLAKSRQFLASALMDYDSVFAPKTTSHEDVIASLSQEPNEKASVNSSPKMTHHSSLGEKAPPSEQASPSPSQRTQSTSCSSPTQRARTLSQERILAHAKRATYGPETPHIAQKCTPKSRNRINTKSEKVLRALLDSTTRPFTISYQEALNAMGHIGIHEKSTSKKGDYRKLIRKGPDNEQVLGKIFAYRPATSTLGHELMHIYRLFIQQQLEDRQDLPTF